METKSYYSLSLTVGALNTLSYLSPKLHYKQALPPSPFKEEKQGPKRLRDFPQEHIAKRESHRFQTKTSEPAIFLLQNQAASLMRALSAENRAGHRPK